MKRRPRVPNIKNLVLHMPSGRYVDPKKGRVYLKDWSLPPRDKKDGYVRIAAIPADRGRFYAHRIVWEVVHGPIPPGRHIDHRNGHRADNRISNLDCVTPRENMRRAIARGSIASGESHRNSKLTAEMVCAIRRAGKHVPHTELAKKYGVSSKTLQNARRRQTWRHIVCHLDGTASVRPDTRMPTSRRPRRRKAELGEAG